MANPTQAHQDLTQAGCPPDVAQKLAAQNLTAQHVDALKKAKAAFPHINWAALYSLVVQYGPQVYEIIAALAGVLKPGPGPTPTPPAP